MPTDPDTVIMKRVTLVFGETATFPGEPKFALEAGPNAAEIYYEPFSIEEDPDAVYDDENPPPAPETRTVTSFVNGDPVPVGATRLESFGTSPLVHHVYVLPAES